jgi:hypothetical protein
MLHHEAKTHDDILKYYYERNDNSLYANHPLDELLESLIGMSGNKEIYISRMRKDLYIDIEDHPYFDHERTGLEQIEHLGKININGITFYENGGYMAQLKAEEERRERDLLLNQRAVDAYEVSAKAAIKSADSAERSAGSAERSEKYSKNANRIALLSIAFTVMGLVWTIYQTNRNDQLEKRIGVLQDSLSNWKQETSLLPLTIKTEPKKKQ